MVVGSRTTKFKRNWVLSADRVALPTSRYLLAVADVSMVKSKKAEDNRMFTCGNVDTFTGGERLGIEGHIEI